VKQGSSYGDGLGEVRSYGETEKGFIMAKQRRNVLACNSELLW
jgi:hypothetical protein